MKEVVSRKGVRKFDNLESNNNNEGRETPDSVEEERLQGHLMTCQFNTKDSAIHGVCQLRLR